MAKVIKRGGGDAVSHTGEHDLTQISDARRPPIIDRETFEARAVALQIRERAQQQADEILAEAQTRADTLLQQAQEQAVTMGEEARAQGYKEGKEQGVNELTEAIAQSALRAEQVQSELAPQITTLAISIARKILGRELEFHPEAVVEIVKQALIEKARQRREIFLRVHPEDLQTIRDHKPELLEVLSRTKEIGLREDPDVERYGVVIETDAGTIDAQLESQLAVFERVLKTVR